jgi:RNA polymerase sigma factor (sigma-70 family)
MTQRPNQDERDAERAVRELAMELGLVVPDSLGGGVWSTVCSWCQGAVLDRESPKEVFHRGIADALAYIRRHGRGSVRNFKSWLYEVMRSSFKDYLGRAISRQREQLKGLVVGPEITGEVLNETLIAVKQAIELLPESFRAVLRLALIEGLSNEEICQRLKIRSSTLRTKKSKALSCLRGVLLGEDDIDDRI